MRAEVKVRQAGTVTVLEPPGPLRMDALGHALDDQVQSLLAADRLALLLDCTHMSAIDSWGLRVLVRSLLSAERRGGKFKLMNVPPRMHEVLDYTRLLGVLETFEDEEAALASFASL